MACQSSRPAEKPAEVLDEPFSEPESALEPLAVSQEVYDSTLAEVREFVNDLNTMINSKNYAAWKSTLSPELFNRISSPEFLASTSESAILKVRNITLKTPEDYFMHVVVPARSNSRVDEIEFIVVDKVKVFYLDRSKNSKTGENEVRRLLLFDLEKDQDQDTWKIID